MSVNPRTPTPEDLIALSSYLDDELSVSERAELEQRLTTDEVLRAELESLRETVALVRSLPYLKAPRNFTLDPTLYGSAPKSNNISFLSRKMVWRLGAVAGVAAAFVLVFGVVLLGGSDNGAAPSDESSQSVGMVEDDTAANEGFEQTTVAQSAESAFTPTAASFNQDETSLSFDATEVALGEDQSTKATALAFSPTIVLSQTPLPTLDGNEIPSVEGIDGVSRDTVPPVATRTLVASFTETQAADGAFFPPPTPTIRFRDGTSLPNAGGGNTQEGQPAETTSSTGTEESETGAAIPPAAVSSSTPMPTPLPTSSLSSTSLPSASAIAQAADEAAAPNMPSTEESTERPEAATDMLDDTTDTSTAIEAAEDESDVFFGGTDADDAMDEEDSEAGMAGPTVSDRQYVALLREIFNALIERLLDLIRD